MAIRLLRGYLAAIALIAAFCAIAIGSVRAQEAQSAEQARVIEHGKDIFKTKATCQFCHKWDGSGDQGYGGNALSLRASKLTSAQIAETVKCGRPGTGMPYHDQYAYTDKRCYGVTEAELGRDTPALPPGSTLNKREIAAVADYLLAKVVGRGPEITKAECEEAYGDGARMCNRYPAK